MYFWLYFHRLYFHYRLDFCDFIFKYSATNTLAWFVLFIYWKLNGVVYIMMVLINQMRRYSLRCWVCLQLFQSDIVLECIFIPAISILNLLRQVLIFFYFAAPLISFLWKIVIETELGKRIASLNCRLIIHHNGSFNPDTESNTNPAFSHFSIVVLNTTIFRRTRSRHRPQNS